MTLRLCASQSPSCSGLLPCRACHARIVSEVVPKAMIAASLNADQATAERFFFAWRAAWKDMIDRTPKPQEDDGTTRRGDEETKVAPTLNGGIGEEMRGREDEGTPEDVVVTVVCVQCGKPLEGFVPDPDAIPVCSVVCAGKHHEAQTGERAMTDPSVAKLLATNGRGLKKKRRSRKSKPPTVSSSSLPLVSSPPKEDPQ